MHNTSSSSFWLPSWRELGCKSVTNVFQPLQISGPVFLQKHRKTEVHQNAARVVQPSEYQVYQEEIREAPKNIERKEEKSKNFRRKQKYKVYFWNNRSQLIIISPCFTRIQQLFPKNVACQAFSLTLCHLHAIVLYVILLVSCFVPSLACMHAAITLVLTNCRVF